METIRRRLKKGSPSQSSRESSRESKPSRPSIRKWMSCPPADAYHVDSADGFRVICVLLVMWFHIWQQSWLSPTLRIGELSISIEPQVRTGYMAVDLMLLLSGFLLFLPFARHKVLGTPLESPRRYYIKRALRIVPCYYLCVLVALFGFALPRGEYGGNMRHLWIDLLSHLTFTHNLFYEGYLGTHLNGSLWTLAVEVQFYLLLPLLGRAFEKRPGLVWALMTGIALSYRAWYLPTRDNFSMYFNRLPAMLDVYANGMMASLIYVSLCKRLKSDRYTGLFFTAAALLAGYLIWNILRLQNQTAGQIGTQPGQVYWRWRLSVCGALFLVAGGHVSYWLRRLLSNRVMSFLSAISFNVYMWHQYLALRLKEWHIPPYVSESMPQQAGEQPWMTQYTWVCFLGAAVLASILTWGVEKPAYRLGERLLLKRSGEKR